MVGVGIPGDMRRVPVGPAAIDRGSPIAARCTRNVALGGAWLGGVDANPMGWHVMGSLNAAPSGASRECAREDSRSRAGAVWTRPIALKA